MSQPEPGSSSQSILRDTLVKPSSSRINTDERSRSPEITNRCCVPGCTNTEEAQPGKVFYPFPQEPWRSRWLKEIAPAGGADKLTSRDRVCSDHFPPNHYSVKGVLREDAVPSMKKVSIDAAVNHYRKRKQEEKTDVPTHSKQPRKDITQSSTEELNLIIHIKEEPNTGDEELTANAPAPFTKNTIPNIYVKTKLNVEYAKDVDYQNHVDIQCQNPHLDIVKSEPGKRTVATQTICRKKLFLSVASITGLEQINIEKGHEEVKTSDNVAQTTKRLLTYFTDPIKKEIKAEIRETNRQTKMLTNAAMDKSRFMQCCESYLNEKIANIVMTHSHIQDKYVGNRYSHDFKVFAQNLYLSNPETYRFVEKIFNLPCKTTIRRLHAPARTGTNPKLIECLKIKVSKMSEKEKVCAICFDVMRVAKNLWYDVGNDFLCGMQEIDQVLGPEPAEYAAVLVIRGLYTKWTQPVSFALMTEKRRYPELKEWVHKMIGIMFDVGLNVKALVADLENDFMDVSLPEGEHYFEIDEKRIYLFYDVRYLFKSVRDTFMQYDFHTNSKVAQWSHIQKVYDKYTNRDMSLMPNITDEHVRPSEDNLDDVKLAIDIFSNSVAAAMHFHVISNKANEIMKDTVEFVTKMSRLHDVLASKSVANAYRGTDQQNQILSQVLEYLQDLEVKDEYGNTFEAQFVTGLTVNIKSAVYLLEELKKENLQYLFTKVLSTNCVETFFEECRRLSGNCCERPTPMMFVRFFRRLFMFNLVKTDDNSEQDLKSTLYKISEYIKADTGKPEEPECESFKRILGAGVGDMKIQWPSIEYIAGYLIWKCLERHPCNKFIEKLSVHYEMPVEENAATLLENFRKYNAKNVHSLHLLKPPGYLVEFVELMDQKYFEYYNKPDRDLFNFGWNTYNFMEEDSFELPCECFPLKFMKILFIRLKIDHCIREHNKISKNLRKPRNQQWKKIKKSK